MRRKISKLLLSSGLVVASSTLLVTSTIVGGTTKGSAKVTSIEAEKDEDNRSSDQMVTNPDFKEMWTTAFTKDDVTFKSAKGNQTAEGIGLSMKNALRYAWQHEKGKDTHDDHGFNISDFQIGLAIGNGKKGCPYKKSSKTRKYLYTSAKNKIDLTESCDVSNPEAPNRYWFWFDINKQHSSSMEQYRKYLGATSNTAKIKALGGKSGNIKVEDTWIKPESGKKITGKTVGSTWSTVGFYGTATAITTSKCTPAGEPKDKNSYNSMEKAALPYKIKRLKCYPSTEADSFYYRIGTAQTRGGASYLADLYVIDIKDWYDKAYENYHKQTRSLYLQSVFQLNFANGQHSDTYTKLEPFWKAATNLGYSAACRKDFQYHYNYYIPLKKIEHNTYIYRIGTDEKHQRVGNEKLVIDGNKEGEHYKKDELPAHSVVKFKGIKTYTDKDGKKWYLKGIRVVDSKPKNGKYEDKTKARFFITDNVGSTSTAQITGTKNATSSLYSTKNGVGSGKNTAGGEFLYTSRKTVLHGNAKADDEDGTEWEIGDQIKIRGKRAGKIKNEFLPAGKKYTYQELVKYMMGLRWKLTEHTTKIYLVYSHRDPNVQINAHRFSSNGGDTYVPEGKSTGVDISTQNSKALNAAVFSTLRSGSVFKTGDEASQRWVGRISLGQIGSEDGADNKPNEGNDAKVSDKKGNRYVGYSQLMDSGSKRFAGLGSIIRVTKGDGPEDEAKLIPEVYVHGQTNKDTGYKPENTDVQYSLKKFKISFAPGSLGKNEKGKQITTNWIYLTDKVSTGANGSSKEAGDDALALLKKITGYVKLNDDGTPTLVGGSKFAEALKKLKELPGNENRAEDIDSLVWLHNVDTSQGVKIDLGYYKPMTPVIGYRVITIHDPNNGTYDRTVERMEPSVITPDAKEGEGQHTQQGGALVVRENCKVKFPEGTPKALANCSDVKMDPTMMVLGDVKGFFGATENSKPNENQVADLLSNPKPVGDHDTKVTGNVGIQVWTGNKLRFVFFKNIFTIFKNICQF